MCPGGYRQLAHLARISTMRSPAFPSQKGLVLGSMHDKGVGNPDSTRRSCRWRSRKTGPKTCRVNPIIASPTRSGSELPRALQEITKFLERIFNSLPKVTTAERNSFVSGLASATGLRRLFRTQPGGTDGVHSLAGRAPIRIQRRREAHKLSFAADGNPVSSRV
jgi:hypothetical protein